MPLILTDQQIHKLIKKKLNLTEMSDVPDLTMWRAMAEEVDSQNTSVDIAIVGKYSGQQDSYLSIIKSLIHSGIHLGVRVNIKWVEASSLENNTKDSDLESYTGSWETIKSVAGIIVPGGFGIRGVEGKIAAAEYARKSNVPFLGICLGMQVLSLSLFLFFKFFPQTINLFLIVFFF